MLVAHSNPQRDPKDRNSDSEKVITKGNKIVAQCTLKLVAQCKTTSHIFDRRNASRKQNICSNCFYSRKSPGHVRQKFFPKHERHGATTTHTIRTSRFIRQRSATPPLARSKTCKLIDEYFASSGRKDLQIFSIVQYQSRSKSRAPVSVATNQNPTFQPSHIPRHNFRFDMTKKVRNSRKKGGSPAEPTAFTTGQGNVPSTSQRAARNQVTSKRRNLSMAETSDRHNSTKKTRDEGIEYSDTEESDTEESDTEEQFNPEEPGSAETTCDADRTSIIPPPYDDSIYKGSALYHEGPTTSSPVEGQPEPRAATHLSPISPLATDEDIAAMESMLQRDIENLERQRYRPAPKPATEDPYDSEAETLIESINSALETTTIDDYLPHASPLATSIPSTSESSQMRFKGESTQNFPGSTDGDLGRYHDLLCERFGRPPIIKNPDAANVKVEPPLVPMDYQVTARPHYQLTASTSDEPTRTKNKQSESVYGIGLSHTQHKTRSTPYSSLSLLNRGRVNISGKIKKPNMNLGKQGNYMNRPGLHEPLILALQQAQQSANPRSTVPIDKKVSVWLEGYPNVESIITDEIKDYFVNLLDLAVNRLKERCVGTNRDSSDIRFPSIAARHGQLEIGCGTSHAVDFVLRFFGALEHQGKKAKVSMTDKAEPAHTFTVTAPVPDEGAEPTWEDIKKICGREFLRIPYENTWILLKQLKIERSSGPAIRFVILMPENREFRDRLKRNPLEQESFYPKVVRQVWTIKYQLTEKEIGECGSNIYEIILYDTFQRPATDLQELEWTSPHRTEWRSLPMQQWRHGAINSWPPWTFYIQSRSTAILNRTRMMAQFRTRAFRPTTWSLSEKTELALAAMEHAHELKGTANEGPTKLIISEIKLINLIISRRDFKKREHFSILTVVYHKRHWDKEIMHYVVLQRLINHNHLKNLFLKSHRNVNPIQKIESINKGSRKIILRQRFTLKPPKNLNHIIGFGDGRHLHRNGS